MCARPRRTNTHTHTTHMSRALSLSFPALSALVQMRCASLFLSFEPRLFQTEFVCVTQISVIARIRIEQGVRRITLSPILISQRMER